MDGTDDEHVRRLQRIAFGAEASAEQRSAALAELDRRRTGDAANHGAAPAAITGDATVPTEADAVDDHPGASTLSRSRGSALRVGVMTGAVALAIGVVAGFAVGWQAHTSAPVDSVSSTGASDPPGPGSRLHSDVFAAMPLALETEAAYVFHRTETPADTPDPEHAIDLLSSLAEVVDTRLLATRPDGVAVYAVRDDTDVCLFATFPEGGGASVCTERGRFPTEGLWMAVSMDGGDVDIDVSWSPDGVLQFTPPK